MGLGSYSLYVLRAVLHWTVEEVLFVGKHWKLTSPEG